MFNASYKVDTRAYLKVPYSDWDEVVQLGAKWKAHPVSKWYIPGNLDPSRFKKWIIDETEDAERRERVKEYVRLNGGVRNGFRNMNNFHKSTTKRPFANRSYVEPETETDLESNPTDLMDVEVSGPMWPVSNQKGNED